MGFRNVLVPYDNSEHAQNALLKAIEMVDNAPDATLHIMEVMAPPQDLVFSSINHNNFGGGKSVISKEIFTEVVEDRTAEASKSLQEKVEPFIQDFAGTAIAEVVYGVYVVDTLVDAAKQYEVDAIVMGSRGLGGIRGMIGSVSYGVLRSGDTPVLIVK